MKLIQKKYVDKKANKEYLNIYLQLPNGNSIPIRSVFKNDYFVLTALAEKTEK